MRTHKEYNTNISGNHIVYGYSDIRYHKQRTPPKQRLPIHHFREHAHILHSPNYQDSGNMKLPSPT